MKEPYYALFSHERLCGLTLSLDFANKWRDKLEFHWYQEVFLYE